MQPSISGGTENCDEAISFLRRIIEQDSVVGALYRKRQIRQAAPVATPDVRLRHIMAACKNARTDSSQIGLDIVCSDVDQDNLKSKTMRVQHRAQITLPR
jgi:hypothetical protein